MYVWWFITIFVYQCKPASTWLFGGVVWPEIEKYHYPGYFTTPMTTFVNGTDTEIRSTDLTPDYRVEEKMYVMYNEAKSSQLERPMRNSPPFKQGFAGYWNEVYWRSAEQALGCYCCTTYRKYVLLAGCAVITTRHIITSANPTVLMLRSYGYLTNFEEVLGGWYDTWAATYNSSLYFAPSRIHIHPMYRYDYETNVSHPIPAMYDLSIWASTYTFYGYLLGTQNVMICERGASGWIEYAPSTARVGDVYTVIGYQFMKSYKRRPLPWYRYIVKTDNHLLPCPKTEWQWFHCVQGEYWGRLGFDSGGGMHGTYQNKGWRRDGMAGICSFSLKLRAMQTAHYFTVVDTYPVLDFLYDAFLGLTDSAWLDDRFEDSKYSAPVAFSGEYIYMSYEYGFEHYYQSGAVPKYRR